MNVTKLSRFYYPEAELVFGITCPLGVKYRPILESIRHYLEQFGYDYHEVRLSEQFDDLATQLDLSCDAEYPGRLGEIWRKIRLGNAIRAKTKCKDVLSLVAAARIAASRPEDKDKLPEQRPKVAHVIVSLKRPEEVETLRRLYGIGFFLVGVAPSEKQRTVYFDELGLDDKQRKELIETDADEDEEFGQRTRDTFLFIRRLHLSRKLKRASGAISRPCLWKPLSYADYCRALHVFGLCCVIGVW